MVDGQVEVNKEPPIANITQTHSEEEGRKDRAAYTTQNPKFESKEATKRELY